MTDIGGFTFFFCDLLCHRRNQNLADPKRRAIDSEKFLKTFFSFGVRFENRISIYPTQILNNKMQTKHF